MEPYHEWSSYDEPETWFDYTHKRETKNEGRSFKGIKSLLAESVELDSPILNIRDLKIVAA